MSGSHFVIDIDKLKAKFYVALNSLLSKFGRFMNEMVTIYLINTFCRSLIVLVVTCDGVSLSPSRVNSMAHYFSRINWRLLFKVYDIQCITDIQCYMNHLSITYDIANCRFRFMLRAKASSNATMYFLANLVS